MWYAYNCYVNLHSLVKIRKLRLICFSIKKLNRRHKYKLIKDSSIAA